jgi:hypothetical protein
MGDIEEIKEVKEEQKEVKKLDDILKRYAESQNEIMGVLAALLVRLEVVEKKLSNPILTKLIDE